SSFSCETLAFCRCPTNVINSSSSLRKWVPRRAATGGGLSIETVALAAQRGDEGRAAGDARQAIAQVPHIHVDHVRSRVLGIAPDVGEDGLAREHPAWMAHEVLEQSKLAAGQIDELIAIPGATSKQVQAQGAGNQRGRSRGVVARHLATNAADQLFE